MPIVSFIILNDDDYPDALLWINNDDGYMMKLHIQIKGGGKYCKVCIKKRQNLRTSMIYALRGEVRILPFLCTVRQFM